MNWSEDFIAVSCGNMFQENPLLMQTHNIW